MLVYGVNELLGWETGNYDVYVERNNYDALFRQINKRPSAFATLAHPQSGDYTNLATGSFRVTAWSSLSNDARPSKPARTVARCGGTHWRTATWASQKQVAQAPAPQKQ